MSKNSTDLNTGSATGRRSPFTTTRRGNVAVRRAATSRRLEREARQTRLAYLALFGVIALVVIVLAGGLLWDYVIYPAQAVATVNGTAIRNDEFGRFQKFETNLLNNQLNTLQTQISQLSSATKDKAAAQALSAQYQQQEQTVQSNLSNVPAYTLQQMESALMLVHAAAALGAAPTPAQLDAEMASIQKQAGPVGYAQLLSNTGVQTGDLRTYFAAPIVVQDNVTKHFEATIPKTQPQGKARHILVARKALAEQLLQELQHGANFAQLAQHWSTDNGVQAGTVLTGTALQQAHANSSAYNGGWLRDPSQPFVRNQPTWITPETQYVAPVLNAILTWPAGKIGIVQSQFGYHVIQVTAHATHVLTKAEITAQAQQKYQTWQTTATSAASNKVNPPDPYVQFPAPTAVGQ